MKTHRRISGKRWRQLSQLVCLAVFLVLFIKTDYSGRDTIDWAVNIIFRIDPLVTACVWAAKKTVVFLLLPALITVILTMVFGRFFCGWICPMGTLLDGARFITGSRRSSGHAGNSRKIKYYLLVFILTAAIFGFPLVGFFDPFSILVRGLALAVYPAMNAVVTGVFAWTYHYAPQWVNAVTEPVYAGLKATVLPFRQKVFAMAVISFTILITVFLLERLERRFFCRNICPLGALLALLSRWSVLRGHGGNDSCGSCRICRDRCRMDAIAPDRSISTADCNLCLDCVNDCPRSIIGFAFHRPVSPNPSTGMTRRGFLGVALSGAVLPAVFAVRSSTRIPNPRLIRPPGALPEPEFLAACVRCGECMKVCIGNALHPAFLEAGAEGMFSPRLIPRVGYCEYGCTLCGQVCPTGAIRELSGREKQKTVIGTAWFDKNRCLPYAAGIPCIVCEEHCPTGDKAIKFNETNVIDKQGKSVTVKQPYVIESLCIGCGICETKCPLPGRSAVLVTSAGETRNPDHALPDPNMVSGKMF